MRTNLPSDFRDRPKLQRLWINLQILFHRRQIKAVCCESFRKPPKKGLDSRLRGNDKLGVACKGCPTLYDRNSSSFVYRFLARVGKRREAHNA